MTNEEAIREIKDSIRLGLCCEKDALNMAIAALEKQIPKKPKTNGDRIRAMSDEELAEELWQWVIMLEVHKNKIIDWLKSESK